MVTNPLPVMTEAEYLQAERASISKHEYYAGEIVAMAGASERHNSIAMNIVASVHGQLRKRLCRVYSSDLRVHIPSSRSYLYPDIMIVYGQPEFRDETQDTIFNPIVVMEVLSPSTERNDRGKKFLQYRSIPTLQEYLLISQDKLLVECYTRQADQSWRFIAYTNVENQIFFEDIDCYLHCSEIYENITFDTDISTAEDEHPN